MLNRNKEPGMGRWNGVGGKLEQGESPLACIIREAYEETGIQLGRDQVKYTGAVTWVNEYETSGMYAFIAEMAPGFEYETPVATPEGILCWKHKDWICNTKNLGVIGHVPHFLPVMLTEQMLYEHRFSFSNSVSNHYEKLPLRGELKY
ncbi:NUDIX domain-containing protein [Paenibacillus sp. MMS18-CY102]|nr:NUDIX domain-containing protein [Paenibacillus sp. MMS18-CY102]